MTLYHPARTDPALLGKGTDMTHSQTCEGCRFWDRYDRAEGPRMPMDNAEDWGWCKRYAARPRVIDEDQDQLEQQYFTIWPLTWLGAWCGDWQPQEGKP
jgi:hypothetical protein